MKPIPTIIPFRLTGTVCPDDIHWIMTHIQNTLATRNNTQFVIDCSLVDDFTCQAIVLLVGIIKSTKAAGSSLRLSHLSNRVQTRMTETLLSAYLPDPLPPLVAKLADAIHELRSTTRLVPCPN